MQCDKSQKKHLTAESPWRRLRFVCQLCLKDTEKELYFVSR